MLSRFVVAAQPKLTLGDACFHPGTAGGSTEVKRCIRVAHPEKQLRWQLVAKGSIESGELAVVEVPPDWTLQI